MNNIAIIPARGGSKRIPKKNIKNFFGKPIISYSIKAAIKSNLFSEIMVSTDDIEIAEISKKYGANIPFLRSTKNADDYATLSDVIIEVINNYEKLGKSFDNICCILPTAPFISPERLKEAFNLLKQLNFDSIFAVVKYSYPIFRALEFTENNKIKMIWPEYLYTRSQDIKPAYYDSGSFYWVKTKALIKEKSLFCNNGSAIVLSEIEAQDIDNESDWKIAELKFKFLNEQKNYNI